MHLTPRSFTFSSIRTESCGTIVLIALSWMCRWICWFCSKEKEWETIKKKDQWMTLYQTYLAEVDYFGCVFYHFSILSLLKCRIEWMVEFNILCNKCRCGWYEFDFRAPIYIMSRTHATGFRCYYWFRHPYIMINFCIISAIVLISFNFSFIVSVQLYRSRWSYYFEITLKLFCEWRLHLWMTAVCVNNLNAWH